MILEIAVLDIRPSLVSKFEPTFKIASALIMTTPRYIDYGLQRCLENENSYIF